MSEDQLSILNQMSQAQLDALPEMSLKDLGDVAGLRVEAISMEHIEELPSTAENFKNNLIKLFGISVDEVDDLSTLSLEV